MKIIRLLPVIILLISVFPIALPAQENLFIPGETGCTAQPVEQYQAKDFSYLFGKLNGISENQLRQHYTLYKGYIDKINEINRIINTQPNPVYPEFRGLQVERSFANNGVLLHELYFSNLTPQKTRPSESFVKLINRDFGSFENYLENLKKSASVSRGWVITAYNCRNGKVQNIVVDSHNLHVPVGIKPLLVMDMWEHAYMIDYGINSEAYVNAFLTNVDWQRVSQRLEEIPSKTAKQGEDDEIEFTGLLRKTVTSGGWVVNDARSNKKYLLLNIDKYKNQAWFKEGACVEVEGNIKKDAATVYMEGIPFEVEEIEPVYCSP